MSLVQVNLRLRTNELRAAKDRVIRLNPQCAAHLANKTVHFIARHAHENMPVVSPGQITSEMNAVGFARNPGDKDWRKTNKEQRHLTTAERIILASIHPNSRFNRLTGGVFARKAPIFSSPSPGGGGRLTSRRGYKLGAQNRLRFWAWVEERAEVMIRARPRSSGFYKLGAAVVKFIFHKNFAPVRMPPSDGGAGAGGGEATAGSGPVSKAIGRVAGGTRATASSSAARASFWVSTTEPDSKGEQRGINRVLAPTYQRAVDAETANTVAYAEKLYAQLLRESGYTVK